MTNHLKYEERLECIQLLLNERFHLNDFIITPIQYEADCPFPYNNFVYRIDLKTPVHTTNPVVLQPGTQAIPLGTTELVIRLTNAAASGLYQTNRVENEVASMTLARTALQDFHHASLVPRIYGWRSAANEQQGWIVQEFMKGSMRDEAFEEMSLSDKRKILCQIADVVAAIQKFELPDSIQGYGGLTFDEKGRIVGGKMTTVPAGPFESYEEFYRETLRMEVLNADESELLKGWVPNGVRARLDQFIEKGLSPILKPFKDGKKVLVHGDLTLSNLLFDPTTLEITAILDFDWSHIGSHADEFLRSFTPFGKLCGPSPSRSNTPHGISSLEVGKGEDAQIWDEELRRAGAERPSTIDGIEGLSGLKWLSEKLCPWMLSNEVVVGSKSDEALGKERGVVEGELVWFLENKGF